MPPARADWLNPQGGCMGAESTLTCRRLDKGRLEAHVVVGDLRLRVSARELVVVDLLREVERMTGARLPVPSWLTPHFAKPMAGQTSLLSEGE